MKHSSEIPSEAGTVASWTESSGSGTITADADASTVTFTRAVIQFLSPRDSREYPSEDATNFRVGQKVLFKSSAGAAQIVVAHPNFAHLGRA